MLRKVLAGLLAAGAVALVLGAVTRALMRLVVLAAGHYGSFTWSGRAGIVLVFLVVALPGCPPRQRPVTGGCCSSPLTLRRPARGLRGAAAPAPRAPRSSRSPRGTLTRSTPCAGRACDR